MGDITVHTQRLQKFGKEITEAGSNYEGRLAQLWEEVRLMGGSWPTVSLGLRVAYQQGHDQFGEATRGAGEALSTLGSKITEVGKLYEDYDRNA